ncbi:ABC transporter [Enterobacter cloacae]|uniref:ABC transporter n=1 Tax=Enterobacter cloacae TaxID=550 RepID=A0A377M350_ENTCL|nr:ABC transporter [Enterobacter cloacae]
MKILNREQGLDDGRIVYEQDLIVSRLQQDPPRHVTGSVYDFVAEGISEQAEYLKRYHEISHLVMTDPSDKNLNELAKVQEMLDHHGLWQLENRINEVLAQLAWSRICSCLRYLAAGCVRRHWAARWSAGRRCCCWMNQPTTWTLKRSTGLKGS